MKRVLFVCLGNICRSPTAEAVLRERIHAAGLSDEFEVDSAGTLAAHEGSGADSRMQQHASRRGYHLTSISRPVVPEDFHTFDYIIAMDRQNLADLCDRLPDPGLKSKLSLLLDYLPDEKGTDVPDPYYGGAQGFETVLDLVESGCDAFLQQVKHP